MRRAGLLVHVDVSMRALAAFLLLGLTVTGCVRRYVEPGIDQPHALVKIRTVHHARSGPQLDLAVRISSEGTEYGIEMPADDSLRIVRVRPLPAGYRVVSSFFHEVMEMRTVYESEQYQCGTTTSGSGTSTYTNPQYCTRQVPRQRMQSVRYSDGECEATAFQVEPLDGAVYLVQYDYFGPGVCSMSCMRQLDTGGGTFQLLPCSVGEPPVRPTSGGEAYELDPAPASTAPAVPGATAPPPEGADELGVPLASAS